MHSKDFLGLGGEWEGGSNDRDVLVSKCRLLIKREERETEIDMVAMKPEALLILLLLYLFFYLWNIANGQTDHVMVTD